MEKMNCFGCRFAKEARNHVRNGQEVRCEKAETLFGGTRWVKVLPESQCGVYEPFTGDDSRYPDPKPIQVIKKVCPTCEGTAKVTVINPNDKVETIKCYKCNGSGKI